MLLEKFFTITDKQLVDDKHIVHVVLNKDHDIYKGHFPENPVVPGVCETQMIKEAAEIILGFKLRMSSANEIKYLAVINPVHDDKLVLEIKIKPGDDGTFGTSSSITAGEKMFLKFRGTFIKE